MAAEAEAITIPSPSFIFRDSTPPPPPPLPPQRPESASAKSKNARERRSSSQEAKSKAQRKDVGPVNLNGADGSVAKPKQSKSRNGCITCKNKRLKCGEEKPHCAQCRKRNVECGGYRKDFKWRPFEDSNVKVNIDKQRGNSPPLASASSSTKPATSSPKASLKKEDSVKENGEKPPSRTDSPVDGTTLNAKRVALPSRPAPPKGKKGAARYDKALASPTKEAPTSAPSRLLPDETPSTSGPSTTINAADLHPGSLAHLTPGLGLSPTLTGMLWPFNTEDQLHQDFINFELPEGFQVPMLDDDPTMDATFEGENLDGDDLVFLQGPDGPLEDIPFMSSDGQLTPPPSASPGSPGQVLREPIGYIYPQPYFHDDSPEMLTFRFDKLTCGILSVVDGPTENPWRSLIWPLAQQSPALYHAITAMTAFHSASDVPQLRKTGLEHKTASIRYIQEGIRDKSFSVQTAIATALTLGFAEAWEQHTVTGNTHIKGAQSLIKQAIADHHKNPVEGTELARLKFLCNAWVYMDVIARLTAVDSDEYNDFDNTFITGKNARAGVIMGDIHPGFGIDFGLPVNTRLDPLMGCANTLFPLIGRVANLVRKVCRSQVNSAPTISLANDLKRCLEDWDPPSHIDRPEDPTTEVEHTLQTAEAYRWATLLHLHSAVPELPSMTSAELAQRVLQYLATVPLASRTVVVQTYPLMVAGCEAKTGEDREWVRNRWAAMQARMRIGIIDKCVMVTEEVWRRRDAYESQPSSNRKLVATADIRPNRRHSQPFVRSPTGTMRLADPGNTGMVFSYVNEADENKQSDDEMEKLQRGRERSAGRDPRMGVMDPAYTVRGHLHWVGVMWDWGWEILLG